MKHESRKEYQHYICSECSKEITKSVVRHPEANDYVRYFCNIDCKEKWEKKNNIN